MICSLQHCICLILQIRTRLKDVNSFWAVMRIATQIFHPGVQTPLTYHFSQHIRYLPRTSLAPYAEKINIFLHNCTHYSTMVLEYSITRSLICCSKKIGAHSGLTRWHLHTPLACLKVICVQNTSSFHSSFFSTHEQSNEKWEFDQGCWYLWLLLGSGCGVNMGMWRGLKLDRSPRLTAISWQVCTGKSWDITTNVFSLWISLRAFCLP